MLDPVTAALAAGAIAGVSKTTTEAVTDAYDALKSAVRSRFGNNREAQQVLDLHEQDPDTYDKAMAKQIQVTGAGQDERIQLLAATLVQAIKDAGLEAGPIRTYVVFADNAQGVTVGDDATVTNNFNGPPAR